MTMTIMKVSDADDDDANAAGAGTLLHNAETDVAEGGRMRLLF